MNKYDWSKVPFEIVAIATTQSGEVKGFSKPILIGNSWCTSYSMTGIEPFKGNWQDSLEERPSED